MEKQRLSKTLAAAGVASRRACEELIFDGRVKVNGEICLVPQTMVDSQDKLSVDDQEIGRAEKKLYYILNKPKGYICTAKPDRRCKLVLDLFEGVQERLFTVGRLDRDTFGMLIVTNDGHFADRVIHPRSNIQKEYLAKVQNEVTAEHLIRISKGIYLEETFVKPVKVTKVRRGTLKIVVKEGKKREVRHMLSIAGLDVAELTRIRIGGLRMGNLPVGTWRPLSQGEMEAIFQ